MVAIAACETVSLGRSASRARLSEDRPDFELEGSDGGLLVTGPGTRKLGLIGLANPAVILACQGPLSMVLGPTTEYLQVPSKLNSK